jgi:hypothetical protein
MNRCCLLTATLVLLNVGTTFAQPEVGVTVGSNEMPVFDMLVVTGDGVGRNRSLNAVFRTRDFRAPGVLIFVTEIDDQVADFIRRVDQMAADNAKRGLGAAVVYLTEEGTEAARGRLKNLAKQSEIRMPMGVFASRNGPREYDLSPDAPLTAVMWVGGRVRFSHALDEEDFDQKTVTIATNDVLRLLDSSY